MWRHFTWKTRRLRPGIKGGDIRGTITRGALGALAVNVAGAGLAFGLHVLLSRMAGLQGYGVYVYAFTWVSVLALGARLGLDTGLVRFLPALGVKQDWPRMKGLLRQSTRVSLAAAITLSGLAALGIGWFGSGLQADLRQTIWVGCLLLPVLVLTHLRQAALRGFLRGSYAEMPDRVLRPLVMASTLLVVWIILDRKVGAASAMAVHLAALTAALVVAHLWLVRALPSPVQEAHPSYETRSWLATSLPLVMVSASHLILGQVDILMLDSWIGPAEAGIYAVATRISAFVAFALVAINTIAAPMISQLYTAQRMTALQYMLTLTARANLAFALVVTAVLLAVGDWILALFGTDFARGHGALVILIGGQLFNALAGPVGILLTMAGRERQAARIMVLGVAVNIALNTALIPPWGLVGAATATATTMVLWNLLMYFDARHALNIDAAAIPVRWLTSR